MAALDPTDLLTVQDVMSRYRLRDRRAARRVMYAAGGFKIGSVLFVRRADLFAYEDRHRRARATGMQSEAARRRRGPLPPGRWRDGGSEAA